MGTLKPILRKASDHLFVATGQGASATPKKRSPLRIHRHWIFGGMQATGGKAEIYVGGELPPSPPVSLKNSRRKLLTLIRRGIPLTAEKEASRASYPFGELPGTRKHNKANRGEKTQY